MRLEPRPRARLLGKKQLANVAARNAALGRFAPSSMPLAHTKAVDEDDAALRQRTVMPGT